MPRATFAGVAGIYNRNNAEEIGEALERRAEHVEAVSK